MEDVDSTDLHQLTAAHLTPVPGEAAPEAPATSALDAVAVAAAAAGAAAFMHAADSSTSAASELAENTADAVMADVTTDQVPHCPTSPTASFLPFDSPATHTELVFGTSPASQMAAAAVAAAAYTPYLYSAAAAASNLYDVGSGYTSINSMPFSTTSIASSVSSSSSTAPSSSQLVSYNGSTYIIHQPAASVEQLLNGCAAPSVSPDLADESADHMVTGMTSAASSPSASAAASSSVATSAAPGGIQSYLTRVSPTTIHWLLHNYETAEGVSLPRSTLYNHYLRHCHESKQDPVNAASFGKLIRSVFLGLRTRRIGTRGNSKYHYYGIRLKPSSVLNQFLDPQEHGSAQAAVPKLHHQASTASACKKRPVSNGDSSHHHRYHHHHQQPQQQQQQPQQQQQQLDNAEALCSSQVKQYFGSVASEIPGFPQLAMDKKALPECVEEDILREFEDLYKDHCWLMLDAVTSLNFSSIERIWYEFWSGQTATGLDESAMDKLDGLNDSSLDHMDMKLSIETWEQLLHLEQVHHFVQEADYAFYQYLVDILLPDVLQSIPNNLTQSIRNFAKNLETWLTPSLARLPAGLQEVKLRAVRCLSQTLKRYTGLNHLAQAARVVLQNSAQINQMLTDLNKVDFGNVQEQASWVCQCDSSMVHRLEGEFKSTLQDQPNLETWAAWLQTVVDKTLNPYQDKPEFSKTARQFLLRWSFYSSMVIRDLTLRSAASFGSFHLIRLLYDEYMFYLVEHRVAKSMGQTAVAVMGLGRSKPQVSPHPQLLSISLPGQNDESSWEEA